MVRSRKRRSAHSIGGDWESHLRMAERYIEDILE